MITVDSADAPAGWSVAVAGTSLTATTNGPGTITLELSGTDNQDIGVAD